MEKEYVVRGAMLYCEKGTHPRRLNLPKCHGVYILNKPIIRKNDCVSEKNISSFGVCTADTPPAGAEEVLLGGYVLDGEDASTVEDVFGFECKPEIVGEWRSVHNKTNVTGEISAVTTNSYLVCACGGLIKVATSGQEYDG